MHTNIDLRELLLDLLYLPHLAIECVQDKLAPNHDLVEAA